LSALLAHSGFSPLQVCAALNELVDRCRITVRFRRRRARAVMRLDDIDTVTITSLGRSQARAMWWTDWLDRMLNHWPGTRANVSRASVAGRTTEMLR
jgi:hypothetical protein